jgi:hypothetical protein
LVSNKVGKEKNGVFKDNTISYKKDGVCHMDLYRYFHPHHNPRLRNQPLRHQEVGELEQAAIELGKALERAELRQRLVPVEQIKTERFADLRSAVDFAVESLSAIAEAHPGDDESTMHDLLNERKNAPGWENWSRLLKERLRLLKQGNA